jgi:SAM-dependent methyltransferase
MDNSGEAADVKLRAKSAYEIQESIWPDTDAWSTHTRRSIATCLGQNVCASNATILNAGCGGNDYELAARGICINLDISLRQCRGLNTSIVGDIEAIPFASCYFDVVVCVGAVLNYSEPYAAIREIMRVTKNGGLVVLDFETTHSAELLFSIHWNKRVSVIERSYAGRMDKTFLFSIDHISRILVQYGCAVTTTHHYHTATAMWRRAFPHGHLHSFVLSIDRVASHFPALRFFASNVILVCRKC